MRHPWLDIPISDYESHMELSSVGQALLLRDILQRTVAEHRPRSLAVLGVAGGNGLESISGSTVRRVVAVDLNADYLAVCSRRHATAFPQFESVCHDLSLGAPAFEAVDCVFAGLVLEYLDLGVFASALPSMLLPGGCFTTVLQLPSPTLPEISHTPFTSLTRLAPVFRHVDPEALESLLASHGFSCVDRRRHELDSGKSFHQASFQHAGAT